MKALDGGKLRLIVFVAVVFCLLTGLLPNTAVAVNGNEVAGEEENKVVYVINLQGSCNKNAVKYVRRALLQAEKDAADYLLVELDAYGSYNEGVKEISDLLLKSSVPSVCYVEGRAYDGAALLALSCDTVVMSPGSCFGSENKSENKNFCGDHPNKEYWRNVLGYVASVKGYSVNAARNLTEPENFGIYLTQNDNALQVSADAAVNVGLANYQVTSAQMLFDDYGLNNGVIIEVEKNIFEHFADVLATPVASTVLLLLTLTALLALALVSGYGIVATAGVVCFGILYFVGFYQLGSASAAVLLLLPAALLLLLLALWFSPADLICGGVGFLCLFLSVILLSPTLAAAIVQIILILIVAVILFMTKTNNEKSKNIFQKLVLRDRTTTEGGYLSQPMNIRDYLGMEGVALTALRPAGAVKIGSERVDVVTEGDFISPGDRVKVIKVDGSSVIVRKM